MGRTVNGKLTGRAAASELRDRRNMLYEEQQREAERKKWEREVADIHAENDAMRRCMALEGELSFYKWWDSDEVPAFGKRRTRVEMIEKRISSLGPPVAEYSDVPPNAIAFRGNESEAEESEANHEGSVADEKADGEKSQQEAED